MPKKEKPRIGRQTPTLSYVLPYSKTYGKEAIALYNKTPNTAQEWQELLLYDILAYDEDGLWTHSKYGFSVSRRNGKSEIASIRELYGLVKLKEHILHTAHRTTTSHRSWQRLCYLLEAAGFKEGEDYKTLKQMGLEEIQMSPEMGGGRINFRTRSSKGGLGEGFDLMVIDEAQEYTDDQASALTYTVSSSPNPQTIYCGTPPTLHSAGTVFTKMRKNVMTRSTENTGWAEWSVEFQKDIQDRDAWYETNPSLGMILTERKIVDETAEVSELDFNIQRLGLWLQYSQKSAISRAEWDALQCEKMPKLDGPLFVGVKFGVDNINACAAVAARTAEGKIFVECLDCQPIKNGIDWIVNYITAINPATITIDGQNGTTALMNGLKAAGVKKSKIVTPSVAEYISANAAFEGHIYDGTLCHMGQPSLVNVVSNCEHRRIGSKGGFGYVAQRDGLEIGLLDSVMLALYGCNEYKGAKKQKVFY